MRVQWIFFIFCTAIFWWASNHSIEAAYAQQTVFDCSTVTEIPKSECEALVILYQRTDGDNWSSHDGWLVTNTLCSWYGVRCGSGHIEYLFLSHKNLKGNLPPELAQLVNLRSLSLEGNQLTGSIPPELGSLAHLEFLRLSFNQLSGNIPPELGKLTTLGRLELSSNQLTGDIPPELGNLTNLWGLNLRENRLTGNIPEELGNLTHLYDLLLDDNLLEGELPRSLLNIKGLFQLRFSNTNVCYLNDEAYGAWWSSLGSEHSSTTYLICESPDELPQTGSIQNSFMEIIITITGLVCILLGWWTRQRRLIVKK